MDSYYHVLVAPAVATIPIPVGPVPPPAPRLGCLAVGGLSIPCHSTLTTHLKHLTYTAMSGAGFCPSSFGVHHILHGESAPVRSAISSVCCFSAYALSALFSTVATIPPPSSSGLRQPSRRPLHPHMLLGGTAWYLLQPVSRHLLQSLVTLFVLPGMGARDGPLLWRVPLYAPHSP